MDMINDNELIYYIKNGNEEAINILVSKYMLFIKGKINAYKLKDYDDCFQESIMCLFNSALYYNESFNKSFNRFFDRTLNNKLTDIRKKQINNYLVLMDVELIDKTYYIKEEKLRLNEDDTFLLQELENELKGFEKLVFREYYINNLSVKEIEIKYNMERKNIYNSIYRINKKIKKCDKI